MSDVVAVILFVGITAYAIFGGADFGAGFWDLVAGGAERGERPRAIIDHSIGPVWEANHVWLIFSLVVIWTAFPPAFASITLTLFVPLTLAALGIVLRGSSFAFRKAVFRTRDQRNFGADVRGRVRARALLARRGRRGDRLRPRALRRQGGRPLVELGEPRLDPRRRARRDHLRVPLRHLPDLGRPPPRRRGDGRRTSAAGPSGPRCVAGVLAVIGIFVLHAQATYVFHGLTSRALVFVILSAACGSAALLLLWRHAHRGARLAAIGAVGSIMVGWGVAQWPYLLPTSLEIDDAAAPPATLGTVVVVFIVAAVVILPSLGLLYHLDQKNLLPEEGVEDAEEAGAHQARGATG